MRHLAASLALALTAAAPTLAQETQLLWGDTHVHSAFSVDAYTVGNRSATPDDAYRFAKGLPMVHPYHRARIQLERPLDFLVVSDHAELLGTLYRLSAGDPLIAESASGKEILATLRTGANLFQNPVGQAFLAALSGNAAPPADLSTPEYRRSIWQETTDITERHNQPGKFTAFVGWEWTSMPGGNNLHRIVMSTASAAQAQQFQPFSTIDSNKPEELWSWLDATSKRVGADFLSIPHNSNVSDGLMFDEVDSEGRPLTADYARTRMRWEPIVEATQIKGDSEARRELSPTDELASFEVFDYLLKSGADGTLMAAPPPKPGSYVRTALMRGLEVAQRAGVNPYQFGVIGSTDSHTGASTPDEDNFGGKMAYDSTPEHRFTQTLLPNVRMSASGLAAVWATENTRDAIFSALRRKEVYATSGPRIAVRFFGGFAFRAADARAKDIARVGYVKGVPMGGDLTSAPKGRAPSFLVHAAKDPLGGNLDRAQIVKGWLDADGKARERVFDVAWSGDREPGADGKLPPVGNTVDVATGRYANTIGAAQLAAVWTDAEFDPAQRAFYYVRVLQIPTPRHTLYDSLALKKEHPASPPSVIQDRAYTSAIWYTPAQ
ncbi:MAG: DUF3604 domain-containing protein [Deltaproteobacteria bacterium]|nr:DUF3604 domain-containing protein [Deltaproteobacteria bacterium]